MFFWIAERIADLPIGRPPLQPNRLLLPAGPFRTIPGGFGIYRQEGVVSCGVNPLLRLGQEKDDSVSRG